MSTKIQVIQRLDGADRIGSFAARCHAGVLRLGGVLTTAVSPEGRRIEVHLTCLEIRLSDRIMVDELEENYGGLITLEGPNASALTTDWVLSAE